MLPGSVALFYCRYNLKGMRGDHDWLMQYNYRFCLVQSMGFSGFSKSDILWCRGILLYLHFHINISLLSRFSCTTMQIDLFQDTNNTN